MLIERVFSVRQEEHERYSPAALAVTGGSISNVPRYPSRPFPLLNSREISEHLKFYSMEGKKNSYYDQFIVGDEAEAAEYDSDGEKLSFDVCISQQVELISTIISNKSYSALVKPHLKVLAYYIIGYMQMTSEQIETWKEDPNQFVAAEDDETLSFNIRISCMDLLTVRYKILLVHRGAVDEPNKQTVHSRVLWRKRNKFGLRSSDAKDQGSGPAIFREETGLVEAKRSLPACHWRDCRRHLVALCRARKVHGLLQHP